MEGIGTMVIKRFGPVSCAKIAGTLYAMLGIFIGAIVFMIGSISGIAAATPRGFGLGATLGAAAIVAFPIFYGCLGFVAALIGAWLYNVVSAMVGGIQLDVE